MICGAASGAGGFAQPALSSLAVTLDGKAVGRDGIDRGRATPLVALRALAAANGWTVLPLAAGMRLTGEDRTVRVMVGSRSVSEEGTAVLLFVEPPVERDGHIYLAAGDAARLFDLSITRERAVLAFAHPAELGSATRIVEIAATPAPRPRPTPRISRQAAASAVAAEASAGRVMVSMDRTGSSTAFDLNAQTYGSSFRSSIDSSGIGEFGVPTGTITLGSKDRNVELGAFPDPLNGLILHDGGGNGIDVYRADDRRDLYVEKRIEDGRTIAGIVTGAPGNAGSDVLAVLLEDGAYDELVFRRLRVLREPWGDVARELIVGSRGVGAGLRARTRGRTFVESTVSFASRGLPLGPNDAPISLDVGHELSAATTVAAGLSTGPQQPLGPFLAISANDRGVLAALSMTNHTVTGSLTYQRPGVSVQTYAEPGSQRASGAQAQYELAGAVVDATLTNAAGTREAAVEIRTTHVGLNPVVGVGVPSGGRAGPILGFAVPLEAALSVEATMRPSGASKPELRFSFVISVPKRRARAAPTLTSLVRVASGAPISAMQLFVDDVPVQRFAATTTRANVTPGSHSFAAETLDGAFGTLETTAEVNAAGDTVDLTLLPERTISGHVRLDPSAVVAPDFSLAGIVIVVEPGDATSETAADGSFLFAKQPFAPGSTIAIDPGTLPRTLRAPGAIPVPAGEAVFTIRSEPIERGTFR